MTVIMIIIVMMLMMIIKKNTEKYSLQRLIMLNDNGDRLSGGNKV